jgi:hypothetical protein
VPLPWTFSRNLLVAVPSSAPAGAPSVHHVRVFSDPWAGVIVVAGRLDDQPPVDDAAVATLWRRVCTPEQEGPRRLVTYGCGTVHLFREHRDPADGAGTPVPSFASDARPRDPSAAAVRILQHGPALDVWTPGSYRLSTFQLARVVARARATTMR